jgi:putative peptide zinc metalloprotease protein
MSSASKTLDPCLPWRLRPDLLIQTAEANVAATWTIKDPLRLTYFYAEAEEMAFLRLLNGRTSLVEILEQLRQQFPESEFSAENLRQFLLSAVNGGLLRACVPGHSLRLNAIRQKQISQAPLRRVLSLLTYRFRGIDPTPVLNILDRTVGWIFQIRFLVAGLLFCGLALVMVLARRGQLESELPGISSLFTATNLPVLALSLLFVKILHELGHGLTCRHYGGECHELGILFVGFMPLLYCDVSDSWLQQDRRKRMLVSAAGIGTELLLAAGFGVLWAISRHGFLHTFFLNVMIVSSLNTILINGNPLLKYDGYYVLSDWLAIPNLASESRAAAISVIDRIVLGISGTMLINRSLGFHWAMAAFGVASMTYRILVITTLMWFMYGMLKLWNLESLISVLVASVVAGFAIAGVRGIQERIRQLNAVPERRLRAVFGLSLVGGLLLIVLFVPLPYSVQAPFTLTPGVCSPIYAVEDGAIEAEVSVGDAVRVGDVVAVLHNTTLESAVTEARGDLLVARARLAALSTQRSTNSQVASALPAAEKAVKSRESRLQKLLQKEQNLTIASPASGTVFAPRNRPRPRAHLHEGTGWFGQPLNPEVRSVWITRQTLLCWVGTEEDLRAVCLFPQEDIELIEDNAEVTLTFASLPAVPVSGTVSQRKVIPETSVDRELIVNRMVSVAPETARPAETLFGVAASLQLDSATSLPPLYSSGFASIRCPPASVASRAWRFICHTFTFQ